jgi:hypothetical protein
MILWTRMPVFFANELLPAAWLNPCPEITLFFMPISMSESPGQGIFVDVRATARIIRSGIEVTRS